MEFVDGAGGYVGTRATTIGFDGSAPGPDDGFMQVVDRFAAVEGRAVGGHNGLIRFVDIIGCGPGMVEPDAEVLSASLSLCLVETTLAGGVVHNSPDFIQTVQVFGLRRLFDDAPPIGITPAWDSSGN
jgi:hypothetical protein